MHIVALIVSAFELSSLKCRYCASVSTYIVWGHSDLFISIHVLSKTLLCLIYELLTEAFLDFKLLMNLMCICASIIGSVLHWPLTNRNSQCEHTYVCEHTYIQIVKHS